MITVRHLIEKLQRLDEQSQVRPVILNVDGGIHQVQDARLAFVWESSYFCSASIPMIELTHESMNKEYNEYQKSHRNTGHKIADEVVYIVEIQSDGQWFRLLPSDCLGTFKAYDDAVQFAKEHNLKKYRILKEQRILTVESITSRIDPEDCNHD